jgi:hypothetical protein
MPWRSPLPQSGCQDSSSDTSPSISTVRPADSPGSYWTVATGAKNRWSVRSPRSSMVASRSQSGAGQSSGSGFTGSTRFSPVRAAGLRTRQPTCREAPRSGSAAKERHLREDRDGPTRNRCRPGHASTTRATECRPPSSDACTTARSGSRRVPRDLVSQVDLQFVLGSLSAPVDAYSRSSSIRFLLALDETLQVRALRRTSLDSPGTYRIQVTEEGVHARSGEASRAAAFPSGSAGGSAVSGSGIKTRTSV